ncbi:MAG: bifunctional phosphopantothenoylcysteine decarboxylase/phosphopantothenate--cysteine ligase CoaBC [bacterium]|nr:bifunctional phosphopantothenoylcysteine decarboxylase/phosphopantothenate--cysteine ligase CoaBC [bacterium]
MLKDKNILVGITGGISAYKICSLIRLYKKAGANVQVVLTPAALNFVTKLTLQTLSGNEVFVENFNIDEYKPEHISLSDKADIFVIAPCSANTLSKISNGICDNLLLSTACAFKKQFLLVPAMNTGMWENPFVQENIFKLKAKGYNILNPEVGFLACGTNGCGRMVEVDEIYNKTVELLNPKLYLKNKKILITAGGTKEKIDPVRYISNNSSGKMGLALAEQAIKLGAEVTLVSTFKADIECKNIIAESACEMENIVKSEFEKQDCIIMVAAVADYRVANYSEQKIKKTSDDNLTLELIKNPDILKEICKIKQDKNLSLPLIVGFCAESENLLENAKIKIKTKGCDFLVANDISKKDTGFSSDLNEVYLLDNKLNITHFEKDTKTNIAKNILEKVFE